jgi:hypothetical protein
LAGLLAGWLAVLGVNAGAATYPLVVTHVLLGSSPVTFTLTEADGYNSGGSPGNTVSIASPGAFFSGLSFGAGSGLWNWRDFASLNLSGGPNPGGLDLLETTPSYGAASLRTTIASLPTGTYEVCLVQTHRTDGILAGLLADIQTGGVTGPTTLRRGDVGGIPTGIIWAGIWSIDLQPLGQITGSSFSVLVGSASGVERGDYIGLAYRLAPTNTPLAILSQPTNQLALVGADVTFSVGATGSPAPSIQWRRDGGNLLHATNTTLTLPNVQPGDAGIYSVVITNGFDTIASADALLTVLTSTGPTELAPYNVDWLSPSADYNGSMPLGNGDIGINLWCQPNNDLIFYVSKTDAWSESGRLLKLGRVRVGITPNPFTTGQPFHQQLNLPNGEILITAGSGASAVTLRVWVDANHPAICVDGQSRQPCEWRVDFETWRTADRTLTGGERDSAYGIMDGPNPIVVKPDTMVGGQAKQLLWYHRNPSSIWGDTFRVQSLGYLTNSLTDPLRTRTFGAAVRGDGLTNHSATRLLSVGLRTNLNLTIVPLTTVTNSVAEWLSNVAATAAAVTGQDPQQRYAAHCAWWQDFWQRHWIVIKDSGGANSYNVTRGYLLQRFINAAGGRGNSPIKFNGSIFTVDGNNGGQWDADYRAWGGPYWFQNTRLPYHTMLTAGDLDLMQPFFKMYADALPVARARVQSYYKHAGAYFPETMYFWGMWNNDNYGWERAGKTVGRSDNAYIRWHWESGIELTAMMLDYFAFTQDRTFASNILLPMAGEIVDLFDHRFARDGSGKITFTPAQALETYQEGTVNPMPEIAGLRTVLSGLLNLPASLLPSARSNQWTRLLGEMPALPTRLLSSQTVLSPAGVLGPKLNIETPELYALFPFQHFGLGLPNLDLARRSYNLRQDIGTAGWTQDPIIAALVGATNDAKAQVIARFAARNSASRFPGFYGPNYDWTPDQDHPSVAMIALQKMLLQCVGDRILLCPAWPADWDVEFKLRAPGNTILEGRVRAGRLENFTITPAARAKDVEVLLAEGDRDADGLPDSWETIYFSGPTNAVAAADADGDGASNGAEYLAGTSPVDPSSVFRLACACVPQGGSNVVLAWSSVANRIYEVQWTTNLLSDSWRLGATNISGAPPTNVISVPAPSSTVFFRVALGVPRVL